MASDPTRVQRLLQLGGVVDQDRPTVTSSRVQRMLTAGGVLDADSTADRRVDRLIEFGIPGTLPEQDDFLRQHPTPVQQLGFDDADGFLERAGQFALRLGKGMYESVEFWDPEIDTKERVARLATLGSFFIPLGGTAMLAGRTGAKFLPAAVRAAAMTRKGQVALTAAQEAAIGAGLSKLHGESPLIGAAGGAVLGGGLQRFVLRGRAGVVRARSAALGQAFRDPQRLMRLSESPLVHGEYAILSPQRAEFPARLNAERFEQLHRELKQLGYEPVPGKGFEPIPDRDRTLVEETGEMIVTQPPETRFSEDMLIVPGMNESAAIELGLRYNQDSIITNRGLIDLRAGTVRPLARGQVRFNGAVKPWDDYFTELRLNGEPLLFTLGFEPRAEQLGELALREAERLLVPAVRTGPGADDFVVGFNHGEAAEEAARQWAAEAGVAATDAAPDFIPGWATSAGRFVDEQEAAAIRAASTTAAKIDAMRAEPGGFERLLRRVTDWPVSQRLEAWYNNTIDQTFGMYRALRRMGEKPFTDPVEVNAWKALRLHAGYADIAEHDLKWGLVAQDRSNRTLRPGLYQILDSVKSEDFEQFVRYGFARRWLAIARNTGRQLPIGPDGQRLTERELQELVDNSPRYFSKVFTEVVDWRNTLLRERLGRSGILPKKRVAAITSSEDFVPLRRPLERLVEQLDVNAAESAFTIYSPVKKLRALGDRYVDWLDVLQKETVLFSKLASEQRVLNTLFDQLKQLDPAFMRQFARKLRVPPPKLNKLRREAIEQLKQSDPELAVMAEGMDMEILALLAPGKLTGGRHIVGGLSRGKRVWYEINDPLLWDSIRSMGFVEQGLFSQLLGSKTVSAPSAWLRAGATLAFEFMARNPIRDVWFALTTAGADAGLLRAPLVAFERFAEGLSSALHQDEWFQLWKANGGSRAALVSMDIPVLRQDLVRSTGLRSPVRGPEDVLRSPGYVLKRVVKSPFDALRAISELSESGTRVGHFKAQYNRLLSEGATPVAAAEEAAFRARNISVDFRVHGLKTAALARAAAFWNPMLQGYRQAGESFMRQPGAVYRAAAYITLPSVVAYLINRRDPDYLQLPPWERAMFWHFKLPGDPDDRTDDRWIRVPKPFELGLVFGTLPEKLLQAIDQQDPSVLDESFERMLADQAKELMPIPTMVQPLIERLINQSFFTGRPIVPRGQEDVEPRYREKPSTSEFAKGLVRMLRLDRVGLDAPTVDHVLWSYTGGLGRTATQWSDVLLTDEQLTEHEMPVIKGFLSRFPEDNMAAEEFYRFAGDVRRASATVAKLSRELRLDDLEDYYFENAPLLSAATWTNKVTEQLAALRHQRELIEKDKGIDFRSRREMADEIVDQEYELLLQANQIVQEVEDMAERQ